MGTVPAILPRRNDSVYDAQPPTAAQPRRIGTVRVLRTVAALALGMAAMPPALAHHAMGGGLPATLWQGLLSGLGHPIIGLDHLAFVVGVGAMAFLLGRVLLLPLTFVAATLAGCALHMLRYDLPAAELIVAATVAIAAVLVTLRVRLPASALAAFFATAGLFHGYAYGESIVGAETTPLAAYIIGFSVIQSGIAVGAALAFRTAIERDWLSETRAMRIAGVGLALVAATALATGAMAG
jgi:urease accessory protein